MRSERTEGELSGQLDVFNFCSYYFYLLGGIYRTKAIIKTGVIFSYMKIIINAVLMLSIGWKILSAQIVISQFSFGADSSEKDEYVEIHNASSDEIVDIGLWKLQYRASRASPWRTIAVIPEDTFLTPKSFYLIASKDFQSKTVSPDLIGNFGFGLSMEGSLRIVDSGGGVKDLVGYGTEAPDSEKKPVVNIIGQVILRKDPSVDTNNNAKDFVSQSARTPQSFGGQKVKSKSPKVAEREYRQKIKETDSTVSEDDKYIRSEVLLLEAKTDYRSGRWLTAYEKTLVALQFDPENSSAKEFQKKMVKDVKKGMEKSIYVGQEEFYARAFLFYSKGDYQNTLNALKKILAFNPRHTEAREFYDKIQPLVTRAHKEVPSVSADRSAKDEEITIVINEAVPSPQKPKREKITPKEKQPPPEAPARPVERYSDEQADELYEKGLREFAEGRVTEAIRIWEQVLKYNPNHQRSQKALYRARKRITGQ